MAEVKKYLRFVYLNDELWNIKKAGGNEWRQIAKIVEEQFGEEGWSQDPREVWDQVKDSAQPYEKQYEEVPGLIDDIESLKQYIGEDGVAPAEFSVFVDAIKGIAAKWDDNNPDKADKGDHGDHKKEDMTPEQQAAMDAFKKFGEAIEGLTKDNFSTDQVMGYLNEAGQLLEGSGFTQSDMERIV